MVNNVNRKDLVNAFQNSSQKLIGGTSSGFSLPALSLSLPLPPSEPSLSFFLSIILLASSLDGGLRTIWLPFGKLTTSFSNRIWDLGGACGMVPLASLLVLGFGSSSYPGGSYVIDEKKEGMFYFLARPSIILVLKYPLLHSYRSYRWAVCNLLGFTNSQLRIMKAWINQNESFTSSCQIYLIS